MLKRKYVSAIQMSFSITGCINAVVIQTRSVHCCRLRFYRMLFIFKRELQLKRKVRADIRDNSWFSRVKFQNLAMAIAKSFNVIIQSLTKCL